MGTTWSLRITAPPPAVERGVQSALDRVVAQMSQWEPTSSLSRLNRSTPGEWQPVPQEFATVIAAALEVADASGGAFDPCLGGLTELWGFGAAGPIDTVPNARLIDSARKSASAIVFDRTGKRACRTGHGLLDLSGIAKGFGVDHAAEWLLASGTRHFLLEVGGELRGEGIRPDGQPWWVDVEVPPGIEARPWRLALHDLSVATSGSYRRGFDIDGRRYSHSLDPHRGRPIDSDVRSVTVIHRSCMLADAWATALTVMGPERAMTIADKQGLAACAITSDREYTSRTWAGFAT